MKKKAFDPIIGERMETVTITLTLDTRKREDLLPVAVRINESRRTIYHRTGLRCTLEEWEKLRKSSKRGNLFDEKRNQLRIYEKVKDVIKELQKKDSFNLDLLKQRPTGKSESNFSSSWVNIADSKKIGTKNAYMDAYKSFTKLVGNNIEYSRIGVPLIKKWEDKMRKNGISNTTMGMYMRACRVIIKDGIKNGYIRESQYPFGKDDEKVSIKKGRSRRDEWIDVPTIKRIINFAPPKEWRESYAKIVDEAINMWVFSYLGNDMNLADIALLVYDDHFFQSNKTELRFIRKKTIDTTDEDIEVIVPIIPELQNIIDKYGANTKKDNVIFPFILKGETDEAKIKKIIMQGNSNIRDRVQAACRVLGIDKPLSMTWARHSFATNLTNAGISERYISQAMGHTMKTVTQGYIGLFPPEKRMKFNQMLLEE